MSSSEVSGDRNVQTVATTSTSTSRVRSSEQIPRFITPPSNESDSPFDGRQRSHGPLYTHRQSFDRTVGPGAQSLREFLRDSAEPYPNPPQSAEERRNAIMAMDRKRRLTSSAYYEGRQRSVSGGFQERARNETSSSSGSRTESGPETASRSTPDVIDLTGSSPPESPQAVQRQQYRNSSFGARSYVLPSWQPDSEVDACPICHRLFTFLFRRHHCRKCGRVVCNDCSPHRITIPRQYIVEPPWQESQQTQERRTIAQNSDPIELTREEESGFGFTGRAAALYHLSPSSVEGGEKVRLCNPCVPDPQTEPLPHHSPNLNTGLVARDWTARNTTDNNRNPTHDISSTSSWRPRPPEPIGMEGRIGRTRQGHLPPVPARPTASPEILRGHQTPLSTSTPTGMQASTRVLSGTSTSSIFGPAFGHLRHQSLDHRTRSDYSSGGRAILPSPIPAGSHSGSSLHLYPHQSRSQPSTRPRVHESDICPICRRLLPPRGIDGNETAREAHIVSCIEARAPATSPGSTREYVQGPIHMLPFVATEKDCLGEDGNAQECSICMVEYDVGDQLARLECLCKFHKDCIVSWLARKSECPIHKVI